MIDDFVAFAAARSRDAFATACPYPFLVGEAVLHQPRSGRTMTFESGSTVNADESGLAKAERARRLVLPVRKTQSTFASMITIGRTRNNDVVISDIMISKFHAFFRHDGSGWSIADAGSQNGTRLSDRILPPKGAGERVRSGDLIHFAQLAFRFLEAGDCWTALRSH
jgi:hypothetical protein